MPNYKFSDFINYSGESLNEIFQIEDKWFDEVVQVISSASSKLIGSNKRIFFEELTKIIDEKIEITSINQLTFIVQLIEESKQFETNMIEKGSSELSEFIKIVTNSVREYYAKSI